MTTSTGWIRIGTSTTWVMLAVGAGLAFVGAAALAVPVSELVRLTSGVQPGWAPTALWIFVVLGVALCVPLVILSNRPASINLDEGLVRVARRTIPLSELRHAYRLPGGSTPDQFVVQLELPRGLDARLPVRSAGLPNLTIGELTVLLELLRRTPIEPKPGVPMRSPIAGELGHRSEIEVIADEVSDALQPFGRVSYAKPTLLLELEDALARATRAVVADDGHGPLPSERMRAVSAAVRGLSGEPRPTVDIMPPERVDASAERAPASRERGMRRGEVEEWIATHDANRVHRHAVSRALGWVIVVAALIIPWIFTFVVLRGWGVFAGLALNEMMGWWAASVLTWPFGVWIGVVLLKRSRALRSASARRAALTLRSRGVEVPGAIRDYFASAALERSYGMHAYLLGLVLSIAFLASGLMFLSLSADMVGGPYSPLPWHAPLGWLLLIPAIPVFVAVLRWQRHMQGRLARAQVEWRLLGNSFG